MAAGRILTFALFVFLVTATALGSSRLDASAAGGLTFTQLSAGYGHTCGLTTEAAVWCWGPNYAGQTGTGALTQESLPAPVIGAENGVVDVSAGAYHTCALLESGSVSCWGSNADGQLGAETSEYCGPSIERYPCSTLPRAVVGLNSPAVAVAAGGYHACVVTSVGGVKCWGSNEYGQLGNGTTTDSITPVDVLTADGSPLRGIATVAGGEGFTCALTIPGRVKCWGENDKGQLGDGTTVDRWTPVDVAGLESGVSMLSAGSYGYHTCALIVDGHVRCWGKNNFGQLGDGTTGDGSPLPVDVAGLTDVVTAITTNGWHSCAMLADSSVMCWGWNGWHQLGTGEYGFGSATQPTLAFSSDPVHACFAYEEFTRRCKQLTGAVDLAAGGFHTCAAPATGGVKCWGTCIVGQLGFPDPCYESATPLDIALDSDSDQLPDSYEVDHGCLDQKIADGLVDADNDGLDNYSEYSLFLRRNSYYLHRPDPCAADTDNDGCLDGVERGPTASSGGERDPTFYWDFFDTPDQANQRDKAVAIDDIVRVVARFGSSGGRTVDPLSQPLPAPSYHPAFDRSTERVGFSSNRTIWYPDGRITVGDITLAISQFGHSCA